MKKITVILVCAFALATLATNAASTTYTFTTPEEYPDQIAIFRSPAVPDGGNLNLLVDLGWSTMEIRAGASYCTSDGCEYWFSTSTWQRWQPLEAVELIDNSQEWMKTDNWVVREVKRIYLPLIASQ
jgi:hypothetical protein